MGTSIYQEMLEKWPASIVARTECASFSGGLLHEKTLANYDSAGIGPEGRFRIGRKVVYPTKSLIAWMEKRSAKIPERKKAI
jgi:hypothetical protein